MNINPSQDSLNSTVMDPLLLRAIVLVMLELVFSAIEMSVDAVMDTIAQLAGDACSLGRGDAYSLGRGGAYSLGRGGAYSLGRGGASSLMLPTGVICVGCI